MFSGIGLALRGTAVLLRVPDLISTLPFYIDCTHSRSLWIKTLMVHLWFGKIKEERDLTETDKDRLVPFGFYQF